MRRVMFYFISVLVMLFVLGCASSMKVNRVKPAEINLSSYKKIAIGGIEGNGGLEVNSQLTQALFDCGRYEVLDRENLNSIIKEQKLSISDTFDPETSAELGKLIGSAAIIFGNVTRRDYNQSNSYSKGTCTDGKGNKYSCTTYYTKGLWNLNVQLKVIDTSTGKILATKAFQQKEDKSVSATNAQPSIDWDRDSVFDELTGALVNDFMKVIAPYTVCVTVKLYNDSKLPEMKLGIAFAERGDWNSAVEQFKIACQNAHNNPEIKPKLIARAHYNLGIALGYSGIDYDQAINELNEAVKVNSEDIFFTEIANIKQFKKDDAKLKQQGVSLNTSMRIIYVIPIS